MFLFMGYHHTLAYGSIQFATENVETQSRLSRSSLTQVPY
jgi:hypothetical protein